MEYYLGAIHLLPHDRLHHQWLPCDGRMLQISRSPALYSLIGNMFGGDGWRTFALPDLRGRVPGGGTDHGRTAVLGAASPGKEKGAGGDKQPTVALTYAIAAEGNFPMAIDDSSQGGVAFFEPEAFLGEIRMFAGDFPPRGWRFCHGQRLNVQEHQALFFLLSTRFGGDGTTFALPDLRGRVAIGADGPVGATAAVDVGRGGGAPMVGIGVNHIICMEGEFPMVAD